MNKNTILTIVAVPALLITAGCAMQSQTQTEREFGDSVRSVTTGQTYDIGAALFPNDDAVTGGDAERLENVAIMHSGDVGDAGKVQQPLVVGAGASQ
jgi:hypothetical protein